MITVLPTWSKPDAISIWCLPCMSPVGWIRSTVCVTGPCRSSVKWEDWKIPWRTSEMQKPTAMVLCLRNRQKRLWSRSWGKRCKYFRVIRKFSIKWFLMQWIKGFSGKTQQSHTRSFILRLFPVRHLNAQDSKWFRKQMRGWLFLSVSLISFIR